jgi:hypothetical protein
MIEQCPSIEDAAILMEITLGVRPKSQKTTSSNARTRSVSTKNGLVIFGDRAILFVGRVDYFSFIIPGDRPITSPTSEEPQSGVYPSFRDLISLMNCQKVC